MVILKDITNYSHVLKVPLPPKSSSSAFVVTAGKNSSREIRFHWKKQKKEAMNGPNFKYVLNNIDETDAHYVIKTDNGDLENVLKISAMNAIGFSNEEQTIVCSREEERKSLPEITHSILVDNNGTFSVLWKEYNSLALNSIVTVFWCTDSVSINCEDGIDWEEVSPSQTKYEIPKESGFVKEAFVSVSQNNASSGMRHVSCKYSTGNKSLLVFGKYATQHLS